jgi:hypothetical protein
VIAATKHQQTLDALAALDFEAKGEAFVEQKFITPLLECLGYETHKDYEVIRHGDDGSAFKLKHPPVEKGARQVKTYNPDYIPLIRKKMFWVIEAKSPKDVPYPFPKDYMVQGLQYCVHPEIQAKYLVVSNGRHTAIHDAHGSVFMEKDLYAPILVFEATELPVKWPEIYEMLSVETLRNRIEADIKSMYDKLCLSSLDKAYPDRLLHRIGLNAGKHAQTIEKHVVELYVEGMTRSTEQWRKDMEALEAGEILKLMELPLRAGESEANCYVPRALAAGISPKDVFESVTSNFDRQSIFRKEQSAVAAVVLYHQTADEAVKTLLRGFFHKMRDYTLPPLNQVECAFLRVIRKSLIASVYQDIERQLKAALKDAPELVRLVRPPTALDEIYALELHMHARIFAHLSLMQNEVLMRILPKLLKIEVDINQPFSEVYKKVPDGEKPIHGFETYGLGEKHYAFKNILVNLKIDPR